MPSRDGLPPRRTYALWIALFLIPAISMLVIADETAWHFAGSAIDGPFQLYNALRRIQAGFKPGVDFQFFHGLGVAYLHYPFYRLLGGDFPASELARELISAVCYPTVFLLVFWAFTGSWLRALCLSCAAFGLTWLLRTPTVVFALSGMLGVRSALPTLLPLAIILPRTERQRMIATGVTLGLALFVSTEQGLAAFAAYVLVSAIALARPEKRRDRIVELGLTLAIAVAVILVSFLVVGGWSGAIGALRYNLRTVPMDQYWYFGAPPNLFLSSWSMAARAMVGYWRIGTAVACALALSIGNAARLLRLPGPPTERRQFAITVLTVYGLVSCSALLGIFNFAYVQPCWRVLIIVVLLELASMADRTASARARSDWSLRLFGVPNLLAAISLGAFGAAVITYPVMFLGAAGLITTIPGQLLRHEHFTVNPMWDNTLRIDRDVIASHRGSDGRPPLVWSTYAGWAEAQAGIFHPSFHYIIHWLGPELRQEYVAKFRDDRPALVQTVRPTYTQYESWLENEDWTFYDELLRWYQPTALTPWSIWWERRTAATPAPRMIWGMDIPVGTALGARLGVPADTGLRLLEVELTYTVHNPFRFLPIVGANPRYLVEVENAITTLPVSLDPYVHTMRFPLLVRSGQQPVFHFGTYSLLPGAGYRVASIRVFQRPLDESGRIWLQDLIARTQAP